MPLTTIIPPLFKLTFLEVRKHDFKLRVIICFPVVLVLLLLVLVPVFALVPLLEL